MEFLSWWTDLPAWLRYGVALIFVVVGVLTIAFVSLRLGAIACGLGIGMFAVGGPSDSEKNGYNF